MFHHIRSLTCGTVNGFHHQHRGSFPGLDGHDTAAPLVWIYQDRSRKSTNLGHYLLMMLQAMISLTVIVVLASRAINIL